MNLRAVAVVVAAILMLASPALAKRPFQRATALRFVAQGEQIYALARSGTRYEFFRQERSFQDDLARYDADGNDTASLDALVRLEQFDNFVYNAMIGADRCPARSRANLRIARQLLDHARADAHGHEQATWAPDLDSVPDC